MPRSENEVADRLRTMSVYDVFAGTLDEAADEIDSLAEEVTRLRALIDTAKADAWDEALDHIEPDIPKTVKRAAHADNPYRKATS